MIRHNSCFLVGNLGMDPAEVARTADSEPVVRFSVAENVNTYDAGEKTYKTVHTNWFHVTTFGSVAERVKATLKKGNRVAIQGRMRATKFKDKAGENRTGFEILADEVAIWKSLPSAGRAAAGGESIASNAMAAEDDLPF